MRATLEILPTARTVGRRISESDFPDLYRMNRDSRVMATLGGIRSEGQTRDFLTNAIDHWHRHGYGIWVFRGRNNDGLVGRAGLRHVEINGIAEVEVLYAVVTEFWRKGFASEVAREIVKLAFERIGLESVVAFTLPTNLASRGVMEKAGFSYERDIEWAAMPHVFYRLKNPSR